MSTKFCKNCNQAVKPKRKIGIGTFILAIMTSGISLLFIPMYRKRCPMCQDTNFGKKDNIVNNVTKYYKDKKKLN